MVVFIAGSSERNKCYSWFIQWPKSIIKDPISSCHSLCFNLRIVLQSQRSQKQLRAMWMNPYSRVKEKELHNGTKVPPFGLPKARPLCTLVANQILDTGLPSWFSGKKFLCNAGDPRSGKSLGERNGNPLQQSCLGNRMVKGAWQATKGCKLHMTERLKKQ